MRAKLFFTCFFVSLLGALLGYSLWKTESTQRTVLSWMTYPLVRAAHGMGAWFDQWKSCRRSPQELDQVVQQLVKERDALQRELIEYAALADYCRGCRPLYGFAERYNLQKATISQVLVKHITPRAHFFICDAGENRGIVPDMVALYNHHLIGRVSEVYPTTCKIVLITDATSRIPAVCAKSGIRGICEGRNDKATMRLTFVSHLDSVVTDDMVLSFGAGLIFPRGFALGTIRSVQPVGVALDIQIQPLVDLDALDYCLLVKKGDVEGWDISEDKIKILEAEFSKLRPVGVPEPSTVSPAAPTEPVAADATSLGVTPGPVAHEPSGEQEQPVPAKVSGNGQLQGSEPPAKASEKLAAESEETSGEGQADEKTQGRL